MSERRRVVAAVVASAALAACGDEPDTPRERARAAVESFIAGCAEADGDRVLDALTAHGDRRFLTRSRVADGCRALLDLPQAPNPSLFTADVIALRVDADRGRGTATLGIVEGWRRDVPLIHAGGEWSLAPPLTGSGR